MTPTKGLTLAEAIVAIFVLLAGVVVMTRLFHTGLRYQTLVDNQSTAVMVAERQMERIRGWSRSVHTCPGSSQDFSNWTGCPGLGGPTPDPDFAGFSVTVTTVAHTLYSPCSLFENLYPPAQRRAMRASARKVSVQVTWGNGLEHNLVSLVARPSVQLPITTPPGAVTVAITGALGLAQGASRPFTATAVDDDNRPLPDLFFNYVVMPDAGDSGGGFGSVAADRDGRACVVRHCIYDVADPPNITGYGVGSCKVKAIARYCGRIITGTSSSVDMQP